VNPDTQLRTRHINAWADGGDSSSAGNKGADAIHFFCTAELHSLFQYFSFHRFFARKALEFTDLPISDSKFRSRCNFFDG